MLKKSLISIGLMSLSLSSAHATASQATEISGAVSTFYLTSSDDKVEDDFIAVLDVDAEGQLANGKWHIYIEGTSTSKPGKVTSIYGESLADAGGAADGDGNGRIQISTAEYYHPIGEGELVVGLIYPSGFTESADWANDETTQFLANSFVNIQTSGAPDYALGIGYLGKIDSQISYSMLLSQAQGLGDLDGNYSTLFDELDDYFFASELVFQVDNIAFHTSLFASTLAQETFTTGNESAGSNKNYGINLSVGIESQLGHFLLRYGYANQQVNEMSDFIGLSWQQSFDTWAFGLGLSHSIVSDKFEAVSQAQLKNTTQFEGYVKYHGFEHFHLTAAIGRINHSAFGQTDAINSQPNILTLRASYEF